MAKEKPDIEVVEEKQTGKVTIIILLKSAFLFILSVIVSSIILGSFLITTYTDLPEESDLHVAHVMVESLQSGARIYQAQEQKQPAAFSDYLILDGNPKKPYTLSLEYIKSRLQDVKGMRTKELTLIFYPDNIAIYRLENSSSNKINVTGIFNFINESKPKPKESIIPDAPFFYIVLLILSLIIFAILWKSSRQVISGISIIIFLFLCFVGFILYYCM